MKLRTGWNKKYRHDSEIWWAGSLNLIEKCLDTYFKNGIEEAVKLLSTIDGHFAFVVFEKGKTFAAVDKTRSYPLFFSGGRISNCAHSLLAALSLREINQKAIDDILMAGYAAGSRTAIKDLAQMRPGEWAQRSGNGEIKAFRYYMYLPENTDKKEEALINELDVVTNKVIDETIKQVDGRPIWIPLSGGLDSRLILCKLHERGYKNLHTYSYGIPGNHEAKIAKKVASRLGVTWEFVPVDKKICSNFFHSKERLRYWRFSDGLTSVPIIQDIATLILRKQKQILPNETCFINGQSGDFISGGHIPANLLKSTANDESVSESIINKHYSLWSKEGKGNRTVEFKKTLKVFFQQCRKWAPFDIEPAALFEAWEWQERQSKYVVNCVRMYEYIGRSWLLPLWHGHYMRFWEKVPFNLKLGQYLFKSHLEKWDYSGVFKRFEHTVWRWPGISMAILPIAWTIGKLKGKAAKDRFYQFARYFGHYSFVYGIYGWNYFKLRATEIRNPVSLMAETWVEELYAALEQKEKSV